MYFIKYSFYFKKKKKKIFFISIKLLSRQYSFYKILSYNIYRLNVKVLPIEFSLSILSNISFFLIYILLFYKYKIIKQD